MQNRKLALAALAAASIQATGAIAQTVPWRVVAAESSGVVVAGLPAAGRYIYDVSVGDVGSGLVGLRVSSPDSSAGYWARQQGTFKRYTQVGVTGAYGPGRSGAEATHVFSSVTSGGSGAGADGQRAFLARAGAPGAPEGATWGLWRWNTAQNVEVARVLTDGALGPGLGAGWVFPNASDFTSGRMMNGGRVLLDADVTSPTGASSHLIAKHVPGQGNQPCMRAGATDPLLAPGLSAGDSFGSVLGKLVSDVNQKQTAANAAVDGLQSGSGVPLHQAVIAMEEANVSFQLMVEVRNKLLDSYQELMRMQI